MKTLLLLAALAALIAVALSGQLNSVFLRKISPKEESTRGIRRKPALIALDNQTKQFLQWKNTHRSVIIP